MQHAQNTLLPPTYEFTKRKRWADLLITEPADTITFVLSLSCTILYCSLTVKELLGWKDTDLIDCDLVDLITCATLPLDLFVSDAGEAPADDQDAFRTTFEESIRNKSELLTYVRLQRNGNRLSYSNTEDALFEIKGYLPECEAGANFFFAVAKPYPSRNVAMLSAYSELKKENERLQQRVLELQNTTYWQSLPTPTESATTLQQRPVSSQWNAETSSSYYPSLFNAHPGGFDSAALFDGSAYDGVTTNANPPTASQNADEDIEEALKKKAKKTHVGEHYVCITCGRTDSPEWRKGPLGPKTLCNACGLRWAKQMRRTDDPAEGGGEGVTAL